MMMLMMQREKVIDIDYNPVVPIRTIGRLHKYTLMGQYAKGSQGKLYDIRDETDESRMAVVKVFYQQTEEQTFQQAYIMQERLMRYSVYNHFKLPTLYYCAREQGLRVIVMQKLGPSLDKLLTLWRGKLPLKTVLLFAEQMVTVLECMHKIAIHGDIQPSNICLGVGSNNHLLHLIDFSLTIYFRSEVPPKTTQGFRGNHLFATINAHNRLSPTRADDLEALTYSLIELAGGTLPWKKAISMQGTLQSTIMRMKQETPIAEICKGLPECFAVFLASVRSLTFMDMPDYEFYRNAFRLTFKLHGFSNDSFEIYPSLTS